MRDSVPGASYSSVCNVLRQWSISLIPTYNIESTDSMIEVRPCDVSQYSVESEYIPILLASQIH